MTQTQLGNFIQSSALVDTHEHQCNNATFLNDRMDAVQIVGGNYLSADLVCADPSLPGHMWGLDQGHDSFHPEHASFEERHARLEFALKRCSATSYYRAKQLMAKRLWGIEDFSLESLKHAQSILDESYYDGYRMKLFKEIANLEHIQIDNTRLTFDLDDEDPEYCLHDIRVLGFTAAEFEDDWYFTPEAVDRLGVEVKDLASLGDAIDTLYEKYGSLAISTKMPHAYQRTLSWEPRTDSDVSAALQRLLQNGRDAAEADRLCVGDWCISRIIEHSIRMDLPIKIHTGYCAGNDHMHMERIRPGLLCDLIRSYPRARFVLMHIGYPYEKEIIALAKHFPNVWVDMCWAWSISEYASQNFVREFVNTVPFNKLFVFGGDVGDPFQVVGYAQQAREGLARALEAHVADGYVTESVALDIAEHVMLKNAYEVFDIEGTRASIRTL